MKDYLPEIGEIKKQAGIPKEENFKPSKSGTRHKVFLSENYVIRFRDDNPKLLLREVDLLREINHELIPKVLWSGKVNESTAMVENRLPGKDINLLWKEIEKDDRNNIIEQIIQFISYLKTQAKDFFYSVNTGKRYDNFLAYLTDSINDKVSQIRKFKQADKITDEIVSIIKNEELRNLFLNSDKSVVHGDLIIHNLLTDGRNLTGVLDWESALFGDPDYDLFRLFYYLECAKAYYEKQVDESFEADYMIMLMREILNSGLISDKIIFRKKYDFVRAVFYLNSLNWAANSDDKEKNISELIDLWNKKGAKQFLA